jgi:hypothetical protein
VLLIDWLYKELKVDQTYNNIRKLFGPEFFIVFGVGVLISGTATALYYSKEHIKVH